MKRHSIKITTFVILLSFITVALQIGACYFTESTLAVVAISILSVLILSHIFLELSLNYDSCFFYSLMLVILSLLITALLYFNPNVFFIQYSNLLRIIILLNWLIPFLYCMYRNLLDRGPRYDGYRSFFIQSSLLFALVYVFVLGYYLYANPLTPSYLAGHNTAINFIPFMAIAAQIEALVYGNGTVLNIVPYLIYSILLFIPFGFYTRLILKNLGFFVRTLVIVFVPLLIEVSQYFLPWGRVDADDLLLALIGSFIGQLLYLFINHLYFKTKDEEFLQKRESYFSFHKNIYY